MGLMDEMKDKAAGLTEKAKDAAAQASGGEGGSLLDKAKGAVDGLKEKAAGSGDGESFIDKAKGVVDGLKEKAAGSGDGESFIDKAKDVVEGLKDKLDKDGDGDIDILESAKGLFDKAKGMITKH